MGLDWLLSGEAIVFHLSEGRSDRSLSSGELYVILSRFRNCVLALGVSALLGERSLRIRFSFSFFRM